MTYFSECLQSVCVLSLPLLVSAVLMIDTLPAEGKNNSSPYAGSLACKPCHEKEYISFIQYSKKARSFESVEKMKKGLTKEEIRKCYFCHTTGYGRGGFISPEETPHLKDTGCEVCHGPGGLHVKTKNPGDIKRHLTMDDCLRCHIVERVRAFRYKPLIHGGGH